MQLLTTGQYSVAEFDSHGLAANLAQIQKCLERVAEGVASLQLQVLPTSNVARFFKQQAAVATHSHWQLLQLAPTSTPGVFKMWALADSSLYCIPLRVPRCVVVNCDKRPEQEPGLGALLQQMHGCKAFLPPGDTPRHLYEVSGGAWWPQVAVSCCSLSQVRSSCVSVFAITAYPALPQALQHDLEHRRWFPAHHLASMMPDGGRHAAVGVVFN